MTWEEARKLGPYQRIVYQEAIRAYQVRNMIDDLRVRATARHGKAAAELLKDLQRDVDRLLNRMASPESLMQEAIAAAAPLYAKFTKPEQGARKKLNPFRFAIGRSKDKNG